MTNFIKNKISTILVFIIASFSMEAFMFLYLGFGFLPTYILCDIGLVLFMSFIVLFLPCGKFQNIFILVLLFIQMIISYSNICIYGALGDVFSFDMLSLVDETTRVLNMTMFPIWPIIFYVVLYSISVTFLIVIRKLFKQTLNYRSAVLFVSKTFSIIGLTLSFGLYGFVTSNFKGDKDDDLFVFSDSALHSTFSSGKQSLIKFGTWGYYFEEFFRQFYKTEIAVNYTKQELKAYVNSKEYEPTSQKLYNVAKGSNVIGIMLESFEWYAIDEELTPTLYALANGYDFGVRDDVTGLYSNFDYYSFGKDENGFTTLSRTDYDYNDGIYTKKEGVTALNYNCFDCYGLTFVNYYSKSKTDYSEESFILGNYPYNNSFTTHGGLMGYSSKNLYSDNDYSFTLPNMLKNNGIDEVNYMHGYLSTFYGRDTLMSQFGFDNCLFLDNMSDQIEKGNSLSHVVRDSQVMDYYLNISKDYSFIPKNKSFFSLYTTVTTHGEYSENSLLSKNYEFIDSVGFLGQFKDEECDIPLSQTYSDMARTYFASCLDTEYMVTILIKYLMENNLFENTMLVLFADHQCYYNGMDVEYKSHYFTDDNLNGYSSPISWYRGASYNEEFNSNSQDRYLVPAMIYSTKITDEIVGSDIYSHNINKFCCVFDLTVTILNMLGIDYNTSYYLGYPAICETINTNGDVIDLGIPAYISITGGIFDEFIFTEDGTTIKYYKSMVDLSVDLQRFSYDVSRYIERWYKIDALYKYNMF